MWNDLAKVLSPKRLSNKAPKDVGLLARRRYHHDADRQAREAASKNIRQARKQMSDKDALIGIIFLVGCVLLIRVLMGVF